jgi:hypothetical protein
MTTPMNLVLNNAKKKKKKNFLKHVRLYNRFSNIIFYYIIALKWILHCFIFIIEEMCPKFNKQSKKVEKRTILITMEIISILKWLLAVKNKTLNRQYPIQRAWYLSVELFLFKYWQSRCCICTGFLELFQLLHFYKCLLQIDHIC